MTDAPPTQGVVAKDADLLKAFGTTDHAACALKILNSGQLQVSDKERAAQLET